MSASPPPSSAALRSAIEWLGRPANRDPQVELVALCAHLAEATAAAAPVTHWHGILERFDKRAKGIDEALKPLLLDATLPLPRRLRIIAQGLVEIHCALAAGYLRVLEEGEPDQLPQPQANRTTLCARAVSHLAEQQEIALLVASPVPPRLWRQALTVVRLLQEESPKATTPPDAVAADRTLKRMLALAAGQPETCAARELGFVADYLRGFAGAVEIRFTRPTDIDEWYWLPEEADGAPVAAIRRPPPEGHQMFFSCRRLAADANAQLGRLATGERPEAIGLPSLVAADDYRNALVRTANRWSAPPRRHFHRRPNSYRVQVCAHLGALWQLLGGETGDGEDREGLPITDWMVLNESAGGFAMMHIAGDVEGIVSGAAVGIRAANEPWRLCLVRWARSDNAEHVELGLELVAPSAQAVRIAYPGSEQPPCHALQIPPLPRLERGETLMTSRGDYVSGPFTLIDEAEGRLKLTECVASRLVMQTAVVEIFEFERVFSPV